MTGGKLNIDIKWPCELHEKTKFHLIEIAHPIRANQLTVAFPGLIYIHSGSIACFSSNIHLNNSIALIFSKGDWGGTQTICSDGYAPSIYFEELTPSKIFSFPKKKIENILDDNMEIYKFLFYISQKVNRFSLQLGSNFLHDIIARTVYVLLCLCSQDRMAGSKKYNIKITQQKLSELIGISRPRLNETLKALESTGDIILSHGKIVVLNAISLKMRLHNFHYMYNDPYPNE
ncbi:Crp/Fnr family transcriptional regulator [Aeromonas enteropelogenes]|uniref:Crp/Fnr family transcriptional regulator n=1 Tax=Aeromonas enteropelogenes TaxID=29489 RepID=UPI003BA362FD